jgi:hypothetical protein
LYEYLIFCPHDARRRAFKAVPENTSNEVIQEDNERRDLKEVASLWMGVKWKDGDIMMVLPAFISGAEDWAIICSVSIL